ncbi:MAG: hypothetical protein ACMUIE_05465, partial [Thermoplasmatota archaeon]
DSTQRALPNLVEWVIVVRVSTDGGASWGAVNYVTPLGAGFPNDDIKDPAIAFDPLGNLFVTWTNTDQDDRINLAYSTNLGSTWSSIHVLPNHASPQKVDYDHKYSSVAADGQYVFVAWNDINTYREVSWMSRAPTSSLSGYPSLTFSTPQRIATTIPYDYQSYLPQLEADTSGVYVAWWDFSTDAGGADNQDIDRDRPSVKFTRSLDHGATWSVSGKNNLIINTSTPEAWHSAPDLGLGPDGTLAAAWYDYTLGKPNPNIFVSESKNGGDTWSAPARANDHYPEIYRENPVVAVDSGGDVHVIWKYRENPTADYDILHSRSEANSPPEKIDDLKVLLVDERIGIVGWTPIREPDFKSYKTYIGTAQNFTLSDTAWPDGPLYNTSNKQLMQQESFKNNIKPDTQYWAKVVVEDQSGLISISNEVTFRTRPVNKPPEFVKDIPRIYMLEDISLVPALNLSSWVENGWITDDWYNGHRKLEFDVECTSSPEPNLTAQVRTVGIDPIYSYLDIFTSKQNWFGTETFILSVTDSGKDGAVGNQDDETGFSNEFTVQVNSTNDIPTWARFQDLTNGWQTPIPSQATELVLNARDIGCLERSEYRFAITANDIDGDFLQFNVDQENKNRVVITVDPQDPQHKSQFKFVPTNDDVPVTSITIYADDEKGGVKNLTITIPVENVNDAPFYTIVDGAQVLPSGDTVQFEVDEYGPNSTLKFLVEADDIDFGDDLLLRSGSERPTIERTGDFNWTVTVSATKEDAVEGKIQFILELLDKQKTDLSTLVVIINVINIPDRPEWIKGKEKMTIRYIHDETDEFEWNWQSKEPAPEWNEDIRFEGFAEDPDADELLYTWRFTNENSQESFTRTGKAVDVKFLPSDGNLSRVQTEKMQINLTVSDGDDLTLDIYFYRELWIVSDDDNDNDGMPDKREMYFFGSLDQEPDYDYDGDGYTNVEEIGFGIPRFDSEISGEYSINRYEMDPTNTKVVPGSVYIPPDDDDAGSDDAILPLWLLLLIIIAGVFLSAIVGGIIVVLRIQKKKEEEEEADIEKRVAEMDRRQKELEGMYGKALKVGEAFGPDQSTLSDLTLDLGGQIYHEEGSQALVKGGKIQDREKEEKKSTGPAWESAGTGPAFEESAPGLTFGESMEVEAMEIDPDVTEIEAPNVDEEALGASMDDLMTAADDFDEEAVKDAGGKVLIGALPMEEQVRQMQGQQGSGGPRLPPPGQEPPEPGTPPMQRPPQVAGQPPQQGLPPARPLRRPQDEK